MGEKYPGMDTSQGNHGTGDLCVPCVSSAHGYTDFHCKQRNRHCDYRCDRDLSAGAAQRVLERIGEKKIVSSLLPIDTNHVTERFSDKTVNEIVKAASEMSRAKTGALIVIEQNVRLDEYERTGIVIDSVLTSQILINIFEHNTPLHDGAVIVRGNRITAATCYLPLSDNMLLSKELGTRHRAGVGISEVTDSLTVIVSEETGAISVAYKGELMRKLTAEELKKLLVMAQNKTAAQKKFRLWKGWNKNEI